MQGQDEHLDMEPSVYETSRSHRLGILIHLFFCVLIFCLPLILAQNTDGNISIKGLYRYVSVPMSLFCVFYINYFILIPYLLFRKRNAWFLAANIILIGLISIGLRTWNEFNMKPLPMEFEMLMNKEAPYLMLFIRDMISLALSAGLSVAIRVSVRWNKTEQERIEAIKSRTEAELENLRNQLNPHFLLNTLNNIYSLIEFDKEKAQKTLHDLSMLLRYVLYENKGMFVTLQKEKDFLINYIELMRIRISPKVRIETDFNISPDSSTEIAPMIFISLIENAFKHGISPTEESFIKISLSEDSDWIAFDICNSNFPKSIEDISGSGIGLEQVAKRLELVYKDRYEWDRHLGDNGRTYHSSVRIKKDKTIGK